MSSTFLKSSDKKYYYYSTITVLSLGKEQHVINTLLDYMMYKLTYVCAYVWYKYVLIFFIKSWRQQTDVIISIRQSTVPYSKCIIYQFKSYGNFLSDLTPCVFAAVISVNNNTLKEKISNKDLQIKTYKNLRTVRKWDLICHTDMQFSW